MSSKVLDRTMTCCADVPQVGPRSAECTLADEDLFNYLHNAVDNMLCCYMLVGTVPGKENLLFTFRPPLQKNVPCCWDVYPDVDGTMPVTCKIPRGTPNSAQQQQLCKQGSPAGDQ